MIDPDRIDWLRVFDHILLILIVNFKLILWLTLRNRSPVGRAISATMFSMAMVYVGVLAGMYFEWFRDNQWRAIIRALVATTTIYATIVLIIYFGGIRETHRQIVLGAKNFAHEVYNLPTTLYGELLKWREARRLRS